MALTEADRKILTYCFDRREFVCLSRHAKELGLTRQTIASRAKILCEMHLLIESDGWRGRRMYKVNPDYIKLVTGLVEAYRALGALERVI